MTLGLSKTSTLIDHQQGKFNLIWTTHDSRLTTHD
jgi:hypothetical protein